MTKKTALITGITGQDGSYLAEFLLDKGYDVVGFIRRASTYNLSNIDHIKDDIILEYGDLTDALSIRRAIDNWVPDEIYNLGAMSFVPVSWVSPQHTYNTNILGTLNILDLIAQEYKDIKYYQASTSEMFGKVREIPQRETTPFYPRSPYGVAKVAAYWTTVNYRESHDLFATNGILFNHESPRRGEEFVTRKISKAVAEIAINPSKRLGLGNLDSKRDWGHAKDYVRAMWMMLQHDEPDDFVIGMEETHSVREFCDIAFKHIGKDYRDFVYVDERFYRPAEVDILLSDTAKAKEKLGWEPEYSFEDLVKEMVEEDYKRIP